MDKDSYIAIDLKSFYASVECVERGLEPLTTCLVVADESMTEKTICLAATPAIKRYGVSGRARLFEVVQKIKFANSGRRLYAPGRKLEGESFDTVELDEMSYRQKLWAHTPITDFWRIGNGYAKRLADIRLCSMGDIARYSRHKEGEKRLHKMFGVNAELLIDHAWGYEPCSMQCAPLRAGSGRTLF